MYHWEAKLIGCLGKKTLIDNIAHLQELGGFKGCGEFSAELPLYNSNYFSFLSYLETLSRSEDESFLELQLHYKTVAISDAISVIYTGNSSPEGTGRGKVL